MRYADSTPQIVARAQQFRREPTDTERRFWRLVRRGALGTRIRRQHPIGPFIADFCAVRERLVIELDGSVHLMSDGRAHDELRDEYLRDAGYRVLRLPNDLVWSAPDRCIELVLDALHVG